MKILGIGDSYNCGAAAIENGNVIAAINEERLNRKKNCVGFPSQSVNKVLEIAGWTKEDIDAVAFATKYCASYTESIGLQEHLDIVEKRKNIISAASSILGGFFTTSAWKEIHKMFEKIIYRKRRKVISNILLKTYGIKSRLYFVDHHQAHAANAYYTSGSNNALIITSDGAGDGLSSTVSVGKDGRIKRVHEIGTYNSIAVYYSYVTSLCGFRIYQHEGKITGLAAYGKPKYYDILQDMVRYTNGTIINYARAKHKGAREKIKARIGNFSREDIAASVQNHLEDNFAKFAKYWFKQTNIGNIVLSGGLFANVKLNQRILQCDKGINSVFIHPGMGDTGLAVGAALDLWARQKDSNSAKIPVSTLKNAFLGPEYSNKEIEAELKKESVGYNYFDNIEKEVAALLAQGKVVARFSGRMEYGPRALGNRSILYQTTDPSVMDWLNKKLKRTEFMPFAPATLKQYSEQCYLNIKDSKYTAEFMTITYDCTPWMKKHCPAVVHVDGTARPQLIDKTNNPGFYRIIEEYHKKTGLPCVINTSFNMHEEPIVCTPYDAVRAFKLGHLDYLAIGNFLVRNRT
jgi:carbamoyltransferase